MTTQPVTMVYDQPQVIELPELILRRLPQLADGTNQSVVTLISQSVLSNLPPSTEIVPPELQSEFLRMQTLRFSTLRPIAQSQVDPVQCDRHTYANKMKRVSSLLKNVKNFSIQHDHF
jgi:hypothetical protein